MSLSDVQAEFWRRIKESEEWLSSGDQPPIMGLTVRSYPIKIFPKSPFIYKPARRSEKFGVLFRIEIEKQKGLFESFIEVRVKPEPFPPWIAIYVVNPDTCTGDEITDVQFPTPERYGDLNKLKIREWYCHWLEVALTHKNVSKMFGNLKHV